MENYSYHLMAPSSFAGGIAALQAEASSPHPQINLAGGNKIFRPLSMKETIEARVNDFNTRTKPDGSERGIGERQRLFLWLTSCSAIAYKGGTSKIKVIPISSELISTGENFNHAYVPIDYDLLQGVELDIHASDVKYQQPLNSTEIIAHPAWLALFEDDKSLLKDYAEILHSICRGANKFMGIWVKSEVSSDELRPLYLYNLAQLSYAAAYVNIDTGARFIRVGK